MDTNLEVLLLLLGYKGGTIHQVAFETGLTIEDILSGNINYENCKKYILYIHDYFNTINKKIKKGVDFRFDSITRRLKAKHGINSNITKNLNTGSIINILKKQ